MNTLQIFKELASRFPQNRPRITELPTGVVMFDFSVREVRYCAENFPSHGAFGLSKIDNVSPFFEGVDESFSSADHLVARITQIITEN